MKITELRGQPHLSASGINDYLDCGLLYKFSRIDKLQPESYSDSLILGRAIHRVLADFYQKLQTGTRIAQKHLEESFDYHWEELAYGRGDIQYKPGKSYHTYRDEGKELLRTFSRDLPNEECKILGVEQVFTCELEDLPVPLVGIFDLVLEDPAGTITIVDHKTTSKAYTIDAVNQNLQMTVYHLAAQTNGYAQHDILLRLDVLIKTKTPKFEQYYTARGDWEEKKTIKKISAVWKAISKGVFIPNDGGWKCGSCGFKTACREWFAAGNTA